MVFCYQHCSDLLRAKIVLVIDLKHFANSQPSASNFKFFSESLDHFFLTVQQNNFGNKIPFLSSLKNNLELMQLTFSLLTALVLTPSSKGKEDKNKCHSKCTSFIFYYQHFFVSLSAIVKNWLRWVTSKIITMISLEKFLLKVRVSERPLL